MNDLELSAKTPALVTGGAGFIGSHITEGLLERGIPVKVIDDYSSGYEHNLSGLQSRFPALLSVKRGDIQDFPLLQKTCQGVSVVFHVAAVPSVPRSIEHPLQTSDVNTLGSLKVFEAARLAGVKRVVFSSSSSIYGESEVLPKHEGLKPEPLSPYAASKLAVEYFGGVYSKTFGVGVVCLRYFNVFGPRQDPLSDYAAVIPRFIAALLKNESPTIYGDGEQTRDFTFVKDVVHANLLAVTARDAVGGIFNIAGGVRTSVNQLALLLASLCEKDIRPKHLPSRAGDVRHSHASIERAQKGLQWNPGIPLREGLQETLQWFKMSRTRS